MIHPWRNGDAAMMLTMQGARAYRDDDYTEDAEVRRRLERLKRKQQKPGRDAAEDRFYEEAEAETPAITRKDKKRRGKKAKRHIWQEDIWEDDFEDATLHHDDEGVWFPAATDTTDTTDTTDDEER